MLLYSLAMNHVFDAIDQVHKSEYTFGSSKISVLGYVDDIAVITDHPHSIQLMIETAVRIAGWSGMRFRPNKCASLVHHPSDLVFDIHGVDLT